MNITASVSALGRPVAFYPSIARAFGDVNAALIVCQFMYWRGRVGEREIYKTQAEIEAETFVPAHTQRRVLKRLSDLGMVTIEKKGIPAKNHFVWNWDAVDAFVSGYILKSQQDVTSSANKLSPLDVTDCNDYSQQIVTTNTETTTETTAETTTDSCAVAAKAAPSADKMPAAMPEPLVIESGGRRIEIPGHLKYPGPKTKSHKTWINYAICYQRRYGTWPLWNATTGGMITQLIKRVGEEAAPKVAAHYLNVNDAFVTRQMHPVKLLLADAEMYHTQYMTGRSMTSTRARQIDQTQSNFDTVAEAMQILKAMENSNDGL